MSAKIKRSFACDVVDIKNLSSLGQRLSQPQDEVSKYLNGEFSQVTQKSLSSWLEQHQDGEHPVAEAVVQEFNSVVQGPLIYEEQRFAHVTLSHSARVLHTRFRVQRKWQETDAQHFNQVLIKDAYPAEIWRIWLSDIEALRNPEDEDAWKEAYEILWPVANHEARRDSNLDETAIQEIATGAIVAIRRILIKNLKPIKSGKALIGMIAKRSRWDSLSKMGKWDLLEQAKDIHLEVPDDNKFEMEPTRETRRDDSAVPPDEQLFHKNDIEFLRKALTRLDERQRALLMAREVDEKKYEELQQQFNLSSDQVGVYLKRAREKLRALFEVERNKPL